MQTEKNEISFWIWVKAHKKQLAIAGISIAALTALVLGLKNKDAIIELWTTLEKSICKVTTAEPMVTKICDKVISVEDVVTTARPYTLPQAPVEIPQHIRNLPSGKYHSAEKAAEAIALNIELLPHQTLVDSYTKYAA